MDKVIKINSRQGGPFTKTNNLVDFDIQPDGTYDMTDSFVNLVANITDAEEGNTPTHEELVRILRIMAQKC